MAMNRWANNLLPLGALRRGATIIILALALLGCGESPRTESPVAGEQTPATEPDEAGEPVRIGLLLTFTGPLAIYGGEIQATVEAFIESKDGELAGRPVELFVEDTGLDPDVAATRLRRLVDSRNVDFLIGPVGSNEALAVRDFVDANQVPTIQPVAFSRQLTTPETSSPYIFRTIETTDQNGFAMGRWAYESAGHERAVVIGSDFVSGHDGVGAFRAGFEEAGGEISDEIFAPVGTTDFIPYLAGIDAGSVDAAYYVVFGEDSIRLVSQWAEIGLQDQVQLMAYGTSADEFVLGPMGDAATGLLNVSPYISTLENEANEEMLRAMEGRTEWPLIIHATTWTGMQLIEQAVQALEGDLTDRGEVIEQMKAAGRGLLSPFGEVDFDDYNQIVAPLYVRRVEVGDGGPHNVLEAELGAIAQEDAWHWWREDG